MNMKSIINWIKGVGPTPPDQSAKIALQERLDDHLFADLDADPIAADVVPVKPLEVDLQERDEHGWMWRSIWRMLESEWTEPSTSRGLQRAVDELLARVATAPDAECTPSEDDEDWLIGDSWGDGRSKALRRTWRTAAKEHVCLTGDVYGVDVRILRGDRYLEIRSRDGDTLVTSRHSKLACYIAARDRDLLRVLRNIAAVDHLRLLSPYRKEVA